MFPAGHLHEDNEGGGGGSQEAGPVSGGYAPGGGHSISFFFQFGVIFSTVRFGFRVKFAVSRKNSNRWNNGALNFME